MKKIIHTEKAPNPVGPYSQAVEINGMIFTAGQIPLNPETGQLVLGDIQAQTRQVLENLRAVLEGADCAMDRVVKVTIFLNDMGDFPSMNKIYAEYFEESSAPARSTVEVSLLPKDVLIEVDVIAVK